jgi:hypothetical protein
MGDEKKGWERHGVGQLEELIKRNVHLIPRAHFYTLVRLVEHATGQATSRVEEKAYDAARLYVYQRIEILNYLLFKQTREYDPDAYTDPLAAPRAVLRGVTLVFVHGTVWVLILAVPGLMYAAWTHHVRWVFWVTGVLIAGGAAIEYRRRSAVHRAVLKTLYPSEPWTWRSLVARMWRSAWRGNSSIDTGSRVAAASPGESRIARASGPDAYTVAEVWAQRGRLKGKRVAIRGRVANFNEEIMSRNWLHLRDGTGDPGKDNDLTITSRDKPAVGNVVVIRGTVSVDKDFGAGYAYPVIIEDAEVVVTT